MWQPEHCEKRAQCQWQPTILVQRLWQTWCTRTEARIYPGAKGTNLGGTPWTLQYARHPTHLWCQPSDTRSLDKKRTQPTRNLKTHFCLPRLKIFWKRMKCGHLFIKDGTNAGFGRSCVAELAKSWPLSLGIAVKQLVASFGSKSHQPTKVVKVTAISGKLIHSSFLRKLIIVSAKAAGKSIIWSVGITLSGNPMPASSEKLCPFQNPMLCMKS